MSSVKNVEPLVGTKTLDGSPGAEFVLVVVFGAVGSERKVSVFWREKCWSQAVLYRGCLVHGWNQLESRFGVLLVFLVPRFGKLLAKVVEKGWSLDCWKMWDFLVNLRVKSGVELEFRL